MEWSGVKLSDDHEMMLCREILCTRTFDNLRNRRKAVPTEVDSRFKTAKSLNSCIE